MRKRKDFVRLEGVRSARLVVIASEGRCTESIYFSAVKDRLRAPNVHVEILARDSNESSPESVHAQIADFMRQQGVHTAVKLINHIVHFTLSQVDKHGDEIKKPD